MCDVKGGGVNGGRELFEATDGVAACKGYTPQPTRPPRVIMDLSARAAAAKAAAVACTATLQVLSSQMTEHAARATQTAARAQVPL